MLPHGIRIIASICLILVFALSVPVQAELASLRISVNGKPAAIESSPYIKEGQTMAPLRAVADALSAKVSWEDKSQSIIVSKKDIMIRLQVNSKVVLIGDELFEMPVAMEIVDGRTFVPLRFLAEALGAKVLWDSNQQEINLMTDDYMDGKISYLLTYENDQIQLAVENISNDTIVFNFHSSQEYDFSLASQDREIWRWSKGRMFNQSTHDLVLKPGDKYQVSVPLIQPSTIDKFTLNAYFLGHSNPEQPVRTIVFTAQPKTKDVHSINQ